MAGLRGQGWRHQDVVAQPHQLDTLTRAEPSARYRAVRVAHPGQIPAWVSMCRWVALERQHLHSKCLRQPRSCAPDRSVTDDAEGFAAQRLSHGPRFLMEPLMPHLSAQ